MDNNSSQKDEIQKQEQTGSVPEEKISQTVHSVTIDGKIIEYSVTAGTILLKEDDLDLGEKAKASLFYIAYTRLNQADAPERPVTFSFNGGPGSSSVWMHLGLLGPKRVLMDDEGFPLPPPYKLVENEFSLLDKTDLVFIDPVSTGYSRAVPKEKPEQYHNIKSDIESVGEFIRIWTTRNNRWSSPKFLIGESYGTTRAGGLAEYLQARYGMYLNGIMLVSSILNFLTADFSPGNDLPYLLFLPTYAAAAWYHQKLEPELQKDLLKTLSEVEKFAVNEYNLALMKGLRLQGKEKADIVSKLARYTGLTTEYIEQTNLRINIHRFVKELRRADGLTIGRLDSRYTGFDSDEAGEFHEGDPSYNSIMGTYTACLYDYIRRDLGFEMDSHYEILSNLYDSWKYDEYQNRYVNIAEKLRMAIQANPYLKVIVCNGYFDLATPYFATEYTFDHINLPEEQRKNVSMAYYRSGHMMYVRKESLAKIKGDLSEFISKSIM
jgi:carboxypeptidase C (cathepsin A)